MKSMRSAFLSFVMLGALGATLSFPGASHGQKAEKTGSHSTRGLPGMSSAARALIEEATGVVCTEAKLYPRSSMAIDEMQARPSLPVQNPEARAGAARAQRL